MDFNNGYGGISSKFTFDNNYADDECDEQQKEGRYRWLDNILLQFSRI